MNKSVFVKTMINVRKHRKIKVVSTERIRNYLLSEGNYHATKFFTEHLSWLEMRNTQIILDKLVYLGLAIIDLGKTVMYEFKFDYVKLKNYENAKLCYVESESFVV